MNLAFADRDFYYADPDFEPKTPIQGLLSKDYAADRWRFVDPTFNLPDIRISSRRETTPFPIFSKTGLI